MTAVEGDRGKPTAPFAIDLSSCVNRYGPPQAVLDCLSRLSGEALRLHPYDAEDRVKGTYSQYLGVAEEELVVGRGITEFIWRLSQSSKADNVVVPTPAYTDFVRAFPSSCQLPAGSSPGALLEQVARLMSQGRTVLISNPHNPCGWLIEPAELAATCRDHQNGVLVVDESYVEFTTAPSEATLVGARADNLVVLRSPGKFYGTAATRVGVAWSKSPVWRAMFGTDRGDWPISGLDALVCEAALCDSAWSETTRAALTKDVHWLRQELVEQGGAPLVSDSSTHFLLLVPASASVYWATLADGGVRTRLLGAENGLLTPCVRISAPRVDERPILARFRSLLA